MNELELFYITIGSDAETVIERFCGNTEMTRRFILRFAEDGSFKNLTAALEENETENAFRAAHTLKGICLNLGFDKLFEQASFVTELLRSGDIDGAKKIFPGLKAEYDRVFDAVKTLLND